MAAVVENHHRFLVGLIDQVPLKGPHNVATGCTVVGEDHDVFLVVGEAEVLDQQGLHVDDIVERAIEVTEAGVVRVVVDSDELLQSPQTGMQRYCEAVGIPYLAHALNWEEKGEENQAKDPTWNTDEHGFHDSLKTSTGLGKQKRNYPSLDSSPDMLRLYEASLPHYKALQAHKISLTG